MTAMADARGGSPPRQMGADATVLDLVAAPAVGQELALTGGDALATLGALPRSRYAAPSLPAVLPRHAHGGAESRGSPGSEDGGSSRPRRPTRLENLLEVILQEQREQADRITRLQEGIDDLNARLSSADRVPVLPVQTFASRPAAHARAEGASHEPRPSSPPPPASPRAAASLVEIATEVALLNALSEVLVRHHEAAQERATAAAQRLQRAEAHVAAANAQLLALPPPATQPPALAEPDAALALEYAPSDAAPQADATVATATATPATPAQAARQAALDEALASALDHPIVRRYRDARAEARNAAARDAAVVERSRELLALTAAAASDEPHEGAAALRDAGADHPLAVPAAALLRPSSPRDHTPASSGAMVLHAGGRHADTAAAAAAAARAGSGGDALRSLLDYVFSDADFAAVLSLLAAVGGNAGPPPASADAIRAVPELQSQNAPPGGGEAACPVCLAELHSGEGAGGTVKAMPCGSARVPHAFHAHCIERWLRMHNSCPTCRTALAEPATQQPTQAAYAAPAADAPR